MFADERLPTFLCGSSRGGERAGGVMCPARIRVLCLALSCPISSSFVSSLALSADLPIHEANNGKGLDDGYFPRWESMNPSLSIHIFVYMGVLQYCQLVSTVLIILPLSSLLSLAHIGCTRSSTLTTFRRPPTTTNGLPIVSL